MALRKVGVIFTAEGYAQYMNELKQVNQEMRTMATESKLAVAQLGNNASITDTYNTKIKSMGTQIEASSTKVKQLSDLQKILNAEQKQIPGLIDSANQKYKESDKTTKELKKSYENLVKTKGLDADETKEAEKAYNSSKKETAALKKEIKELETVYSNNAKQLEKLPNDLAKAELATQQLRNEAEKLHAEYRKNGGALADSAKKWQTAGTFLTNTGQRMQAAGSYMTTRFTAPIVAGFSLAINEAKNFQSEMGTLLPLIAEGGNITADHRKQVEQLGTASRDMAVNYGKNTSEINTSMAELIRNGYTSSQVLGMLPNVLDASLASGEELGSVMGTTANVLSQFNLKGKDTNETLANTQRVVDGLTYVANATSSGFYDLGEGMAYVGPVANTLNMSVEETASLLGILSDNGIEASQGGTALRGALTRLLKPSKQNAQAMEELGISTEDYKAGLLDFPTILDTIAKNTKDLTDEQKAALIAQAFGTESQSAMNALVSAGGNALRDMTKAAQNATGATKEIAEVMKQTPEFKFQKSLAQLRDVGIEIGSKVLPVVTDVVSGIGDWVDKFNDLDDSTQDFIISAGLWLAATGPMLSTTGKLVDGFGKTATGIGTVIKKFGEWTTPVAIGGTTTALSGMLPLLGLGAVAIAGVGGMYAYMNSEAYKAHRRMQEFPDISGLTEAQANSLREVRDEVSAIDTAIDTLDGTANFDTLNGNIQGFGKEIQTLNDEKIQTLRENFATLPTDVQESLAGALENTIANIESQTQRVQAVMDEINELTKKGLDENGVLQDAYQQQVTALTDELMSYYSLSLAENADQQREIYSSLTKDITEMNQSELSARLINLNDVIAQENSLYEQQQAALFEMWQQGSLTEQEYNNQSLQVAEAHNSRLDVLNNERIKTSYEMYQELAEQAKGTAEESLYSYEDFLKSMSEEFGLTFDEIESILNSTDLTQPVKNMAKAFEDSTPQVKTAINEWNSEILKFAEQSGKAVEDLSQTDLQSFIDNIVQTGMSWSDLQLITKNAEIDDNTRQLIENAATAQGGWDALIFAEKNAKIYTYGEEELSNIISLLGGDFASLTDEQKQALVEVQGAQALTDLLYSYGIWGSNEPVEPKQAVVEADAALSTFKDLFVDMDLWNNAEFLGKLMDIDTTAPEAQEEIYKLISEWSGLPVDEIKQLMTETNANETTEELSKIGGAVQDLDGRHAVIYTREDGSTYIKGDLSTLGEQVDGLNGKSATVGVSSAGAVEAKGAVDAVSASVDNTNGKNATVTTNILSMIANTISVGLWNAAVKDMIDKSSRASTFIPGMIGNTLATLAWNAAGRAMFDKSSTFSTRVPGIYSNTNAVWEWINAIGNSYNKTSTLTTVHRSVYRTDKYAEGGHIDAYATGGNIAWGGMFAAGGNVPTGYAGIVGEAGPEIFQVTKSGVTITPLAAGEKARGVKGAIEDVLKENGGIGGGMINITINNPVLREDQDIRDVAKQVTDVITRDTRLKQLFNKGKGGLAIGN